MKKLILAILMVFSLAFVCKAQSSKIPYTAGYSSNFTTADPSFSEKVLTMWKDYDNNTLDQHAGWLADTVTMLLSDGTLVKGKSQNMAGVKEFRGSIKNLKTTIDAWVSLKSLDRDQNVVCIWGNENFTDKDGKEVSRRVHEVWMFDSSGKISMILQYTGMGNI